MSVVDPDHEGSDLQYLVGYYRDLADEPGEIVLGVEGAATTVERVDRYRKLGITWLASGVISAQQSVEEDLTAIGRGPPPW